MLAARHGVGFVSFLGFVKDGQVNHQRVKDRRSG